MLNHPAAWVSVWYNHIFASYSLVQSTPDADNIVTTDDVSMTDLFDFLITFFSLVRPDYIKKCQIFRSACVKIYQANSGLLVAVIVDTLFHRLQTTLWRTTGTTTHISISLGKCKRLHHIH